MCLIEVKSKGSFNQNYLENCGGNNPFSQKLNKSGSCTVIARKFEKFRN